MSSIQNNASTINPASPPVGQPSNLTSPNNFQSTANQVNSNIKYRPNNVNANTSDSTNVQRIIQGVVDVIIIIIILVIFILVYYLLTPTIGYFTCADTDIIYPKLSDIVPYWAVILYGLVGPVLFIIFIEFKNSLSSSNETRADQLRQFAICTFHAISLFSLGVVITVLLTEISERWIGRLRPNFLAVCLPNASLINCTVLSSNGFLYNPIFTGGNLCIGDTTKVDYARLSFPSEHASFSSYTMLFLIIYLEARLFMLSLRYIKTLIQMTAAIATIMTSVTRIVDYHNRASDVIGGVVLGSVIALFITLVVGRVLWVYKRKKPWFYDFDQVNDPTIDPYMIGEMFRI